jgi:hypothetical protein
MNLLVIVAADACLPFLDHWSVSNWCSCAWSMVYTPSLLSSLPWFTTIQ